MNPSIPPRDLATINLFKRRTVLIWMILALSMIGLIVRLVFLQAVGFLLPREWLLPTQAT